MNVLVTGGAGYIGSHVCVELLVAGFNVTVFDNFCNSHPEVLARAERIANKPLSLVKGDIRDCDALIGALRDSGATAVLHFAGLKSVAESVLNPLRYYDNNVAGTLCLLEAMTECGVKTLLFSSSAAVYSNLPRLPLTEDHPLSATSPYGRTKLTIEEILGDLFRSDPTWHISILRYFNAVGSHPSGLIGEDPQGTPANLLPLVTQVAVGRRKFLHIFGNDYATPDGTGVRDYIHVVDLALGHLKALERLQKKAECLTINLGTGFGYSVLDVVRAFEKASGKTVPYKIGPRRVGDIAVSYADVSRAWTMLGWRADRGLETMCNDVWRWQSNNPRGYASN